MRMLCVRTTLQYRDQANRLGRKEWSVFTCISRENSYSSSVSTLMIIALFSYSTASCDKGYELARISMIFKMKEL